MIEISMDYCWAITPIMNEIARDYVKILFLLWKKIL